MPPCAHPIAVVVGAFECKPLRRTQTKRKRKQLSWALPGTKVNASFPQNTRSDKKYMVNIDGRTIHFGAKGYEDFTTHKDTKRNANYMARHSNENWNDPMTAGFWARWLLWNKPSLKASVDDLNKSKSIRVTRSRATAPYVSPR